MLQLLLACLLSVTGTCFQDVVVCVLLVDFPYVVLIYLVDVIFIKEVVYLFQYYFAAGILILENVTISLVHLWLLLHHPILCCRLQG